LLTNYCQTLSSMIAWMTLCPSPPPMSFENGHVKLGLTQPLLLSAVRHCREQCLIVLIFVTSPCHLKVLITTFPIQIRKATWKSFICELQLWVIHLVPKTNLIISKLIDEFFIGLVCTLLSKNSTNYYATSVMERGRSWLAHYVRHPMTHLDESWNGGNLTHQVLENPNLPFPPKMVGFLNLCLGNLHCLFKHISKNNKLPYGTIKTYLVH
jgi:hypothetical protein